MQLVQCWVEGQACRPTLEAGGCVVKAKALVVE